MREPLPADRVNETIVHELDSKDISRLNLAPTDQFDTIQTIELPVTDGTSYDMSEDYFRFRSMREWNRQIIIASNKLGM